MASTDFGGGEGRERGGGEIGWRSGGREWVEQGSAADMGAEKKRSLLNEMSGLLGHAYGAYIYPHA